MNNNILKSLRRTMLSVAAAAISIGFTACADEMFETKTTTTPANSYKISIPANMGGGDTRAIAYNSQTGGYDATFETTDYVFVFDLTKNAEGRKKAEGGDYWEATNLRPDANGKTVNLIGELAFAVYNEQTYTYSAVTPEVGDELMLFYNNNKYLYYSRDYSRGYNEKDIADYAIAKVKITSINDDVIKTEPSSFWNPQSIYKINFTGIPSSLKIKKVIIQSEKNKLVSSYEPTRIDQQEFFGNVSYNYGEEGIKQHELTFLLRFADNPDLESTSGDVITFRALGSDDHYYSGTKSVTHDLENGMYYQAEVPMTDEGLDNMTIINTITSEPVSIVDEYIYLKSKDAAYTASNSGLYKHIFWYGGENAFTLNNLSIKNKGSILEVVTDYNDVDNTKEHYLLLDGDNTFNCVARYLGIWVGENCSLAISTASTGGKLHITGDASLDLYKNATLTIQNGEITVDNDVFINENSRLIVEGGVFTSAVISGYNGGCCMISKSGKVRIPKNAYVSEGSIKAASGYILNTATEGDFTVYTVSLAPDPIALSSVTKEDIGKIIASDGNVYVPNYDFPEGISPVAMIANISSTGHGLAIAMDRIKVEIPEGEHYYPNYSFSWDASYEGNQGKNATGIFNDWAESNSVTFNGTWRFATAAEWQQMALDCGINGDANEAGDEMVAEGLVAKLKQAGISCDDLAPWTGETGEEAGKLVAVYFSNSYWDEVSQQSYLGPYMMRISKWNTSGDTYNILPAFEF